MEVTPAVRAGTPYWNVQRLAPIQYGYARFAAGRNALLFHLWTWVADLPAGQRFLLFAIGFVVLSRGGMTRFEAGLASRRTVFIPLEFDGALHIRILRFPAHFFRMIGRARGRNEQTGGKDAGQ